MCIRVFIGVSDHTYMSIYVCIIFKKTNRKSRVCMHIFIEVNDHTCMSICVCTVFLKKIEKFGLFSL
jgi:hypothetical protein